MQHAALLSCTDQPATCSGLLCLLMTNVVEPDSQLQHGWRMLLRVQRTLPAPAHLLVHGTDTNLKPLAVRRLGTGSRTCEWVDPVQGDPVQAATQD